MRVAILFVLLSPSLAFTQTEEMVKAVERKLETLKFVAALEAPGGGFYVTPPDPKTEPKPAASLRATNGAVRAWKYLGGESLGSKFPNKDKHAAFVLSCLDPKTGGFAEPGGKPDVTITSIGVMAAAELGIPHEKYAKAMDYLKANAKTFEEVRIGAAAVEAWGVKECPFKLDAWVKTAEEFAVEPNPKEDIARGAGSVTALLLRLGQELPPHFTAIAKPLIIGGQRKDGGWGKDERADSDIETTYRVMRALMLMKEKPKDAKALRAFVESHRNKGGGYATKPGEASSMSGVYYAAIISKWLDDMEAKK